MVRWNPEELDDGALDTEPISFVCAYDGSEVATSAFRLFSDYLLPKRKNSTGFVISVEDASKTYLPLRMRRAAIESEIEVNAKMAFPGRVTAVFDQKQAEKTVGQTICEFSNARGVDFLIVGMFGRKGVKDNSECVIASNANYALQYARCSTILVETPFLPYTQVHFCVAMDRTKSSEKALVDALLLSEPDDTITILHIKMRDEQDRDNDFLSDTISAFEGRISVLLDRWNAVLKRPRNVRLVSVDESDKPPAHDILEWAFENNVQVMCVGADQDRLRRNKHYLGSCSTSILVNLVREGIPVVVAHFDQRFFNSGDVVDLPRSATFSRPGSAEPARKASVPQKYTFERGSVA